MSQFLFHRIFPKGHELYIPRSKVLEEGITFLTPSNRIYMILGKKNRDILEKYKPANVPEWLDFSKAIAVDLVQRYPVVFSLPVFTDKILVFDSEIVSLIYDQEFYEDYRGYFEEAENFDTGMTLDELYRKYWESMLSLDEYLATKKYPLPQVLLFEPVPKELLTIVEDSSL